MLHKTIKHNGRNYYVYFGMAAELEYCEETDMTMDEAVSFESTQEGEVDELKSILSKIKVADQAKNSFIALKHGYRKAKVDFPFLKKNGENDYTAFYDHCDEIGLQDGKSLMAKIRGAIDEFQGVNITKDEPKTKGTKEQKKRS